jgi:prolipoprotein diacylglyceryl transferase
MTATSLPITYLASIPSPEQGVWHLGPLPLRAYALCIISGVVVALWVGERRLVARGAAPGTASDIAVWAIPFGLVGARLYHVVTTPELYFGEGRNPVTALYVWEGGLGIWGAIALGALGAWLACRRYGVRMTSYADALAPGLLLAQAVGRLGNYFNQELYGGPTDLPWGLEIDAAHRPFDYADVATFHPTFLYEALWNVAAALVIIAVDRRLRLGRGRVFALYVAIYCIGRAFVESLRIDEAHVLGPFRVNIWVSLVLFVLAMTYFVAVGRSHPDREPSARRGTPGDDETAVVPDADADGDGADVDAADDRPAEAAGDGDADDPSLERSRD